MTQNILTGQRVGKAPSVLEPAAGERAALWLHRIVVLLAFLMVFFPPFNPGRISGKISGNLTLLTSANSFSTVTTKLSAYMTEGNRFALRAADMRQSSFSKRC